MCNPPLPGKALEGEERDDEPESGCRPSSVPTTFLEFHGTDRKPVPWKYRLLGQLQGIGPLITLP